MGVLGAAERNGEEEAQRRGRRIHFGAPRTMTIFSSDQSLARRNGDFGS
jgi:hypothetical protein